MANEGASIATAFEEIGTDVLAQIKGLSDEQLNRPMALPEANTLFVLATHLVGAAEFWIFTLAGGRPSDRERAAEFRAAGSEQDLRARYERWLRETRAMLEALPADAFDRPAQPPEAHRGALGGQPLTVRDCLLHAINHSALHQGHIQLTRQLITEAPS